MSKVIIQATMSLDGFIASPDDSIDWAFRYGTDQMVDEMMKTIGVVILGKRVFDIAEKTKQLPYGGMVKVPHETRTPITINGLTFDFITDGVKKAVELAKTAAGNKSYV